MHFQMLAITELCTNMTDQPSNKTIESYVFANTPAYLYRKLIADDYVLSLAKRDNDSLLSFLNNTDPKKLDSVARAYASILALLLKGEKVESLKAAKGIQSLDWSEAIISIFKQKNPATNEVSIKIPRVQNEKTHENAIPYTYTKA